MKYSPIFERTHPLGPGIQRLYRFRNGYGASVVRYESPIFHERGVGRPYHSYTNNEKEWEVAVIRWHGEKADDFALDYTTPVASDVIGYVTDEGLEPILEEIALLGKKKKNKVLFPLVGTLGAGLLFIGVTRDVWQFRLIGAFLLGINLGFNCGLLIISLMRKK